MKKGIVWLMIPVLAAGCFLFSCSDTESEKTEKSAIEKMSDETAKKVTDTILAPIEDAKEVKRMEENRLKDLREAEGKETSKK